MQAEYVLPSLVSLQQPPLFSAQRNAPEAVESMNRNNRKSQPMNHQTGQERSFPLQKCTPEKNQ